MLKGLFKRRERITVQVLIKGLIGAGWIDVDRAVKLPVGTTLAQLVARGDAMGIPLTYALEHSPHLSFTLMWNGERRPVAEHGDDVLADGDEIFLLAPLAGG